MNVWSQMEPLCNEESNRFNCFIKRTVEIRFSSSALIKINFYYNNPTWKLFLTEKPEKWTTHLNLTYLSVIGDDWWHPRQNPY